jgi:hypoxanthine phosphoribosyltransferase
MVENLKLYISREEIARAVQRLAGELDQVYFHRTPVLVGVLKGGFIFLADLVREMRAPLAGVELVQAVSYGAGQVSSGRASISRGVPREAVQGRDVVLVEDIIDTGITTSRVLDHLKRHGPASLEVCALLDKPARRRVAVQPRFVGFTIPDRFVVGYGLDLDQKYRQLPDIYTLEE